MTEAFAAFLDSVSTVYGAMPFILYGALITIGTVLLAMLLGFVLGLPMAVGQVYGRPALRRLIGIYVWFFRGVPILVLLYLFYFGLTYQLNQIEFSLFGKLVKINLNISAFTASCIVLGLTSAAYQSQIFRGAINSIPSGQLKAARALGMPDGTAIVRIVLPQALRLAIPGWSNEYSILLKDSALVSVLGTMDLMARAKAMATGTEEYPAFYITAALLYFLITALGVRALRKAEQFARIPGYTQH
ncbi:ABC transporter permease subunit [Desulfovibrio sp. OttesenSCG-928-A18]|nr:ABC transporter permease subunit [Desulfovibrio sp. OttesenSCG-928-A18]